jgi:hypothetical protein
MVLEQNEHGGSAEAWTKFEEILREQSPPIVHPLDQY